MELSINGLTWYIVFVRSNSTKLRRDDGTYTIGMTDNITRCIYLLETLTGDMLCKVLTHELTHAVAFSYNCHLNAYTEEIVADFIANYGSEIIDLKNGIICKGLHNTLFVI